MSIKSKKRFKNIGRIVGISLFTLVMLTNIKLALLDDNEIASGDISLFGIELNLFEATYACGSGGNWEEPYIGLEGPGGSSYICCVSSDLDECWGEFGGCGWGWN